MKNVLRKALALLAAATLTACAAESAETEVTTAQTVVSQSQTEEVFQEKENEKTDFFNENYGPLDESYDPYAGNLAVTAANNSAETVVKEDAADQDTQDTTTVTTEEKKTEAKQTEATQIESEKDDKKPSETSAKSEENSSSDAELIISTPNGWNDGTNDFSQLDAVIRNNGKTEIGSWTAKISVGKNAQIEQSWNCDISISNGILTAKPVEYNSAVAPNSEVTFGLILKNPGTIDTEKSELTCSAGTFAAGNGLSGNSNNNNSNNNSSSKPAAPVQAKDVPAPNTDDWLSVKGNKIVNKEGKEVWLTGINWFGYNTGTNTFDGLWTCDLNTSLSEIADRGFNLLRVPISAELINSWADGNYPTANFNQATNSYLVGMNSLEIFDYAVGQCRANGLKIMIDIHSAKTDSMGHMKNMWYEGSVSEQDYLDALSWMAERYKNDDTIIAYDLKNEPHGKANENPRAKWDNSKDSDNWKYIAEKAAMAVLKENPNALVMVEGIEIYPKDIKSNGDFASTNPGDYYTTWWGGNLRGVKDNPIDLGKYQNKLVYSPHDYGPTVYQQDWFKDDYTYKSLYNDVWHDNWLYIHEDGTAPLLIGEWGGFMRDPNLKWMTYLRQLISEYKLHHTFWCFNSNSGDTGGLVKDDFRTWDEEKYEFVKQVLWQENGKFVGLDHEIPLGGND